MGRPLRKRVAYCGRARSVLAVSERARTVPETRTTVHRRRTQSARSKLHCANWKLHCANCIVCKLQPENCGPKTANCPLSLSSRPFATKNKTRNLSLLARSLARPPTATPTAPQAKLTFAHQTRPFLRLFGARVTGSRGATGGEQGRVGAHWLAWGGRRS